MGWPPGFAWVSSTLLPAVPEPPATSPRVAPVGGPTHVSVSPTVVQSERAPSTVFLELDVHKESVTIAVLPSDAAAPAHVEKPSYDLKKLRRYLERLGPVATLRACYEASGAGYVL
jgi:hypothetical protein